MMREYARIEDGTVREKIILADAADITKRYHPSLVWVETTGLLPQPQESWLYNGVTFSPPPPPPAPPTDGEQAEEIITGSKVWIGLIRVLIDPTFTAQGKTEQQIIDAIKAKL